MAIPTIEGAAVANWSGSSSGSISITTSGTDRIVVVQIVNENNGLTPTVSSVTATGLTFAKRSQNASVDLNIEVWWAYAAATLTAAAISITLSGATDDTSVTAFAVAGAASFTAPWDANSSLPAMAQGGGTLIVSGVSTSASNSVVLGFWGSRLNITGTPLSGFTTIAQAVNSGGSLWSDALALYQGFSSPQSGLTVGSSTGGGICGVTADAIAGASGGGGGSSIAAAAWSVTIARAPTTAGLRVASSARTVVSARGGASPSFGASLTGAMITSARAFAKASVALRVAVGVTGRSTVAVKASGRLSLLAAAKTAALARGIATPSFGALLSGAAITSARALGKAAGSLRVAVGAAGRSSVAVKASGRLSLLAAAKTVAAARGAAVLSFGAFLTGAMITSARAAGKASAALRVAAGSAAQSAVAVKASGRLSLLAAAKTAILARGRAAPSVGAFLTGAAITSARAFAKASAALRIGMGAAAQASSKGRSTPAAQIRAGARACAQVAYRAKAAIARQARGVVVAGVLARAIMLSGSIALTRIKD